MTRPVPQPPWARRTALVALFVCVIGTDLAFSQPTQGSQRPFRGLFGGQGGSSDRPQTLDLTAAVFAGYDDDIFARGASSPRPEESQVAGTFIGAQAALQYAKRYPTATLSAGATTSLRWLTEGSQFVPTGYGANVGYSKQLGPRTSVGLRQGIAYRPRFIATPFAASSTIGPSVADDIDAIDIEADDVVGSGPPDDVAITVDRDAFLYSGRAMLSRTLTSRSSLSFFGGYSATDFRSDAYSGVSNRRYRVGGRYSYSLTPYLSARLGYGYRYFETQAGSMTGAHDLDVGVNYGRPFSVGFGGNRTRLTFTTGTAAVVRSRSNLDGTTSRDRNLILRAVGTATLLHQFVAPWQAQLQYVRSVGFVDGLSDAYSGDRVTASLGGLLGRRGDVLMSVGYISGAVGLSERNFTTTLGTARARYALTSTMALFAQYVYYQYDYTTSIAGQLGVPPSLERQGIRGGLTVWLPLWR